MYADAVEPKMFSPQELPSKLYLSVARIDVIERAFAVFVFLVRMFLHARSWTVAAQLQSGAAAN
jgi:hypothetical protein